MEVHVSCRRADGEAAAQDGGGQLEIAGCVLTDSQVAGSSQGNQGLIHIQQHGGCGISGGGECFCRDGLCGRQSQQATGRQCDRSGRGGLCFGDSQIGRRADRDGSAGNSTDGGVADAGNIHAACSGGDHVNCTAANAGEGDVLCPGDDRTCADFQSLCVGEDPASGSEGRLAGHEVAAKAADIASGSASGDAERTEGFQVRVTGEGDITGA